MYIDPLDEIVELWRPDRIEFETGTSSSGGWNLNILVPGKRVGGGGKYRNLNLPHCGDN